MIGRPIQSCYLTIAKTKLLKLQKSLRFWADSAAGGGTFSLSAPAEESSSALFSCPQETFEGRNFFVFKKQLLLCR